ncbi:MAG: NAD(P)H-dependent oxidoreductase subunit E [Verrucomicrobiota bacterium]|nr:NAD(P)H-dependent oxidoreductase subunit E [Verrucomicrobiota bacterium]
MAMETKNAIEEPAGRPKIVICMGSSCFARGNEKNLEYCESYLSEHGLRDEVDCELSGSLCTGNCANGPVVIANGKTYTNVDNGVMRDILEALFK